MVRRFEISEAQALANEEEMLRYLLAAEKKYLKRVQQLTTLGDKDDLDRAVRDLWTTRAEIEKILMDNAEEWVDKVVPKAYKEARETMGITIDVVEASGVNVRKMKRIFNNFVYDDISDSIYKGGYKVVKEAFTEWNEETAKWLRTEFQNAYREGLPIGNYTTANMGSDKTLVGRLTRKDGKLRGRMIDVKRVIKKDGKTKIITTQRHYPSELEALNTARIETARIENEAAIEEADRVGLTHCYNANPNDMNTTIVCRRASKDGVMTTAAMKKKHGFPPRIQKMYHLCRSKLVFVDPAWVS
jgi:hypothetical protein